jgi:CheY-like chemotaxis protein
MLAGNPAFAEILSSKLRDDGYEVAGFTSVEKLTSYLRFAPVDVVLLDTDVPGAPAIDIARGLRQHIQLANDNLSIVALTRLAPAFHKPLLAAGIDAIVQKPIVPSQLSALLARIAPTSASSVRPRAFQPAPPAPGRADNVIPLFGRRG